MDHVPLLPALLFRDAVRLLLDSNSTMRCLSWDKAVQGRQAHVRFSARVISAMVSGAKGTGNLPDALVAALASPPGMPTAGHLAYAHLSPTDTCANRALYSHGHRKAGTVLPADLPSLVHRRLLYDYVCDRGPPTRRRSTVVATTFVTGEGRPDDVVDTLGLEFTLEEGDRGVFVADFPTADRPKTAFGGRHGEVSRGDVIMRINDLDASNLSLAAVKDILGQTRQPVVTFLRRGSVAQLVETAGRLPVDAEQQEQEDIRAAVARDGTDGAASPSAASASASSLTGDSANGVSLAGTSGLSVDAGPGIASPVAASASATDGSGPDDGGSSSQALVPIAGAAVAGDSNLSLVPASTTDGTVAGADGAGAGAGELSPTAATALLGDNRPKAAMSTYVYSVTFTKPKIGLKLVGTRRGLIVQDFTKDFDRSGAGKSVVVGDFLVGVNQVNVGRMSVEAAVKVIVSTPTPRVLRFVRLQRRPPNASQHVVYAVTFSKQSVGLRLAEARLGLRVTGFAETFDRVSAAVSGCA
jgi:hypothetical protein